jgi:hypothetical protein
MPSRVERVKGGKPNIKVNYYYYYSMALQPISGLGLLL